MVNLARHLDADPEAALRGTNMKFERRFGFIEQSLAALAATRQMNNPTFDEMEELWNAAKSADQARAASE